MRDGWRKVRLGEVTEQYIDRFTVDPDVVYRNLGVKWYAEGVFAREPKSGREMKATNLYRVKPGQFIYNRLFATEGSFALVTQEYADGVVSNEFPVFDLDCTQLLPEYLLLHFQQPSVWKQVSLQCVGTTKSRSRWNERRFVDFEIDLPPLAEQRRIVDLIASLDEAIEASETLSASGVHARSAVRAVGLAEHASGWTVPLDQLATTRLGKMLSAPTAKSHEPAPYLRNANVQWGRIELDDLKEMPFSDEDREEFSLRAGDVLICEGGDIGRAAVLDRDLPGVFFQKALHRVRCSSGLVPTFLQLVLEQMSADGTLLLHSGGSTIPHLTGEKLKKLPIPVAPIAEQLKLVEQVSALDDAINGTDSCLESLRALRSELLTALLSGAHEVPASYDEMMGLEAVGVMA